MLLREVAEEEIEFVVPELDVALLVTVVMGMQVADVTFPRYPLGCLVSDTQSAGDDACLLAVCSCLSRIGENDWLLVWFGLVRQPISATSPCSVIGVLSQNGSPCCLVNSSISLFPSLS